MAWHLGLLIVAVTLTEHAMPSSCVSDGRWRELIKEAFGHQWIMDFPSFPKNHQPCNRYSPVQSTTDSLPPRVFGGEDGLAGDVAEFPQSGHVGFVSKLVHVSAFLSIDLYWSMYCMRYVLGQLKRTPRGAFRPLRRPSDCRAGGSLGPPERLDARVSSTS